MGSQYIGPAVVADVHSLSRCGLISLLRGNFSFEEFHESTHFNQVLLTLEQDRTIRFASIDFGLPGLLGGEGLRELRLRHPSLIIVALSEGRERARMLDVLAAGANGCLTRNMAPDDMVAALGTILAGQIYVPPTLTDVADPGITAPRNRLDQVLTGRQREVLEQMILGKSNREIAEALSIAENTVKVHLATTFRLLGVRNRAGAAAALSESVSGQVPEPYIPGLSADRREPATLYSVN